MKCGILGIPSDSEDDDLKDDSEGELDYIHHTLALAPTLDTVPTFDILEPTEEEVTNSATNRGSKLCILNANYILCDRA